MPVLNLNEDERNAVIAALHHERVRLTGEWSKAFDDEECSVIYRDSELERIASAIDLTTDLRRRIEVADAADNTWPIDPILGHIPSRFDPKVSDQIDITVNGSPKLKYVIRKNISTSLLEDIRQAAYASLDRLDAESDTPVTEPKAAWHHKHGWLHPKKAMETAQADIEAGEITREEVADALGVDLAEVDAENARDRVRQDQMSPGAWTTLPDYFGEDDLMFDVTDPADDLVVIASGDTQTDGTMVGFHTFPTEADKSVNNAIWALITRNFAAVSEREIQLAEKVLRANPGFLNAIKSSVEGLHREYSQNTLKIADADEPVTAGMDTQKTADGKVRIDITVGGKTLTVDGHESLLEALSDLNRRSL